MAAVEERMWWYRGLHARLIAAWRSGGAPQRPWLLDAGCGTGGFLARLAANAPGAQAFGLELDETACSIARAKSGCAIAVGDVHALPFVEASLDAIFSADVLCHRGVEAAAALAGFRRCLKPGGMLILNLPAYRWLYSAHDAAVDNARRFDRGELVRLLAAAGFAGVRARYWNSLLFPLMLLRRKLGRARASDVALLPAPVERLFSACLVLEGRLGEAGIRLPFGGSILATAVRP